jgi:hypothetical protein
MFALTIAFAVVYASNKEVPLEELKARAQNAKPEDKPNLCVQIAERQIENANKLYSEGKDEEALAAIRDVTSYSEQAGKAAGETGKRLKNTEIALRRMSHRLSDLKRTLPYDSQAAAQEAVERLDKIRTELLNHMFGKNPK